MGKKKQKIADLKYDFQHYCSKAKTEKKNNRAIRLLCDTICSDLENVTEWDKYFPYTIKYYDTPDGGGRLYGLNFEMKIVFIYTASSYEIVEKKYLTVFQDWTGD